MALVRYTLQMTVLPLNPSEVAAMRAATPFDHDSRIHLNHAGDSPSSQAVLDTQLNHLRRECEIGGYEAAAEAKDADKAVYQSIATMLRAEPQEIARLEHATAAWNAGFWSVPMKAGQRIVTAEAAYGANAVAFLHAERTVGVRVEVVPGDGTGQLDVSAMAQAVGNGDDVALIAVTHVPTNGGLINPAAEVGALARAAGVPYLLDACQSVGQLDLDVNTLQCDLLSATGRKYLRGPRGSGFLYVSKDVLGRLLPSRPDHKSAHWVSDRHYEFAADAERFEHWEYNHAAWLGLGAAVDETLAVGLDRIEATVRRQGATLRQALVDAGFPVFDLGAERCGIVTTNVDGIDAGVAKEALSNAGINTSVTTPDSTRWDFDRRNLGPMLRLSVHATTTDDELARAVDALTRVRG